MIPGREDFRTIWQHPTNAGVVQIIDQRKLPHEFVVVDLQTWRDGASAISDMLVRGAPLIGATAAWSVWLASLEYDGDVQKIKTAISTLAATRPTAVNLHWSLSRVSRHLLNAGDPQALGEALRADAQAICEEDVEISRAIGEHGLTLLREIAQRKGGDTVNILTHCNAGALATINWGTATAPIYFAHQQGMNVHVWVDETRPRNQGSQLTAWELAKAGIPHTLIVDNAGGHLMQHGKVDICITGTDRTTHCGDVANKIGTYLKALAAHDNAVPFYVALPSTTIDWSICDGIADIPIEERDTREVSHIPGRVGDEIVEALTVGSDTAISNYAFDVTPARLVTGLITEYGICDASEAGLASLFPEARRNTQ